MQKPFMSARILFKPILFPVQPNSEKVYKSLTIKDITKTTFSC